MCVYFFIWPILEAGAEILQKISFAFWAMEFQEKSFLRFPELYSFSIYYLNDLNTTHFTNKILPNPPFSKVLQKLVR